MLNQIVRAFEGAPLQTLTWNDRPCWVAAHVGERIGYGNGGRAFAQKILGAWGGAFTEGVDFAYLEGAELSAFKAISRDMASERSHVDRSARLLVLFESGVNLALMRTRKPLGVRLQQFLAREVLPQITRTGSYAPAQTDARIERLEHRFETSEHRFETAMARVTESIETVTTLVRVLTGTDDSERHVHIEATEVVVRAPRPPPEFVFTLTTVADALVTNPTSAKRRLIDARLWSDPRYHAEGFTKRNRLNYPVPTHWFHRGVVLELLRREAGELFAA